MGNPDQQGGSYSVNEIFSSVQGEGFWTGLPAVFIRLAGCNLSCPWCDTDYSERERLTAEDIKNRITSYKPKTVILTGGEPLIQPVAPLVSLLRSAGCRIHLETNGTIRPEPDLFDWIAVSPKTACPAVKACDELRVVLAEGENPKCGGIRAAHRFVSPRNPGRNEKGTVSEANLKYCLDYVMCHPEWRLSVQLHKYLGIQ